MSNDEAATTDAGSVYLGERVAITGAASGIGRAMALELARRGAHVAVSDIEKDRVDAVAEEILSDGGKAMAYRCDVTSPESFQGLASDMARDFGGADMVFNSVGNAPCGPLQDTRIEEFRWLFEVSLVSIHASVLAFLPALRASAEAGRPARFVNTASEGARREQPGTEQRLYGDQARGAGPERRHASRLR